MINQIDECFKMRGSSGGIRVPGMVSVDSVWLGAGTVRPGSKVVALTEVNRGLGLI